MTYKRGKCNTCGLLPLEEAVYMQSYCICQKKIRKQKEILNTNKDAERMKFLHSVNKDKLDWEWGVARVRFDKFGQVEAFNWGLSDSSDLDKAIDIAMIATNQESEG